MDIYRKKVYLNGGNLMVDATGIRRRLSALTAIGYDFRMIGDKLGMDRSHLGNLNNKRKQKVYPETADKIKTIYEELSMLPPPDNWLTERTARQARQRGCVGPLAWDDETIDDTYTLPEGLNPYQAYLWFWNNASMTERIEWVLEHGLSVTRTAKQSVAKSLR